MSSLYPSLEDMQVHKVLVAQENAAMSHAAGGHGVHNSHGGYAQLPSAPACDSEETTNGSAPLYPGLGDFMGLELTRDVIALNMPEYVQSNQAVSVTHSFCYCDLRSIFN